jgi:hypothetical protein
MAATLRRLPALAGLAVLAGTCAELAGHRAFARLVRRDVQALHARASPARAGVITEEMLAGQAGDPAAARDQYAALLPVMERVLGPEHPDTLSTRASLAHWTRQVGEDKPAQQRK